MQKTPSFVLPGTSLATLSQRAKNTRLGIQKAGQVVATMETWPSDACSGHWYDEEGKLLIAAFADHIYEVGFLLSFLPQADRN